MTVLTSTSTYKNFANQSVILLDSNQNQYKIKARWLQTHQNRGNIYSATIVIDQYEINRLSLDHKVVLQNYNQIMFKSKTWTIDKHTQRETTPPDGPGLIFNLY